MSEILSDVRISEHPKFPHRKRGIFDTSKTYAIYI